MTITPDSIRSGLEDLAGQETQANLDAQHVKTQAAMRRDQITARMAAIKTQALTSPGAAEEYEALVLERGKLDLVLGS